MCEPFLEKVAKVNRRRKKEGLIAWEDKTTTAQVPGEQLPNVCSLPVRLLAFANFTRRRSHVSSLHTS